MNIVQYRYIYRRTNIIAQCCYIFQHSEVRLFGLVYHSQLVAGWTLCIGDVVLKKGSMDKIQDKADESLARTLYCSCS
jgi:hypothetical protein